ncbi:hypothetical protein CC1G_12717 [Coprinopsis cinerea okayama7|uniref:Uncharacterized protein n=1 Tax=Coprinopsis cinerea (strain Okayama-7 / 130 / ATCC MYA-4618 / FGSC 9003) TaxID=240176 RepID=A8P3N5_COPC7|nr:hypothetical protein CC1G_12717 [Coprinopsis cinerea okayama7\|eukprot:XP_001838581.1 hypothetical protein CC1G_12717 [Coprinopsis cinerea okayama7\
MLFVFLLYYSLVAWNQDYTAYAFPKDTSSVSEADTHSFANDPVQPRASNPQSSPTTTPFNTNYRSTANIVWICTVTVFTCTWVSVHPNVDYVESNGKFSWRRYRSRLYLMFWGLAAPEFLVVFAFRQWLGSRRLTATVTEILEEEQIVGGINWTHSHSHLVQMGGLLFWEGKRDRQGNETYVRTHAISAIAAGSSNRKEAVKKALNAVLHNGLTYDEIWDRSKGDGLSKAVTAVQIS